MVKAAATSSTRLELLLEDATFVIRSPSLTAHFMEPENNAQPSRAYRSTTPGSP